MSIPCEPEVIERLRSTKRLQGKSATGGFAFDLDLSTPALVVAIHAGHNVREELLPLMQISEKDRLFEEDPATRVWSLRFMWVISAPHSGIRVRSGNNSNSTTRPGACRSTAFPPHPI